VSEPEVLASGDEQGRRGRVRAAISTLRRAVVLFFDADAHRWAASIGFYAIFSVVPLVLIAVAVAEHALGGSASLRAQVISFAARSGSPPLASVIESALDSMARSDASPLTGIGLGLLGLLFGASGVFTEIHAALRRILRRPAQPKRVIEHVLAALLGRLFAVAIVLATCFLLLVTTTLRGAVEVLILRAAPDAAVADMLVSQGLGLLAALPGLTLCYRLTPEPHLPWSAAIRGACVAAFLFYAAQKPFAWMIVHLTTYAAYGAVGALLAVLTWFYLSACILLFGAAVAADRPDNGSEPPPSASWASTKSERPR
jgi:membrane protein